MTMISLSGVNKHYDSYHALRNINLDIEAGEFFSLLGPSGCGKTTLLRTLAGVEEVESGTLKIDTADMAQVPPNRRPTNMVFQSYAIFPHLNVAQNVAFGLRKSDLSKPEQTRVVGEALEMVGLDGFGARAANALSGGQRQRVALARALVLKPKVILLDEPLSALDKKLREQMQLELRRLQRQVGITFILVTHDQEEALIMSDRIAVMFEGQIAQLADPQTLYRAPASRKVGEFIGTMNVMPVAQNAGSLVIAGLGQVSSPARDTVSHAGIRPETMSILFPGEPDRDRVAAATIADRAYYGDMTYYEVGLDGLDKTLTISMKNLMGREILEIGTPVRISWREDALVFFDQ